MGLKVTSKIFTDNGDTSEAYLNIPSIKYLKDQWVGLSNKTDSLSITVNTYLNREDRKEDSSNKVNSSSIKRNYSWVSETSPNPLSGLKEGESVFKVAYDLLKNELEAEGLSVENDL
jgi:hypothetical protein